MSQPANRIVRRSLLAAGLLLGCSRLAYAQDVVLVACDGQNPCSYTRGYAVTLQGNESVRLMAPGESGRSRTARLGTLPGLYREPASGALRTLAQDGELGEIIAPARMPRAEASSTASPTWTLEYRDSPRARTRVPLPLDKFVALLRGPRAEHAVIEFIRREVEATPRHPLQDHLIRGAIAFASDSDDLRHWRETLQSRAQESLDSFKAARLDPARMEVTLADGMAAVRILRLITPDAPPDSRHEELTGEYHRLVERFAIAGALKSAGMHEPFLEKLNQIGIARWSRPELLADLDEVLTASAQMHYRRAMDLFSTNRYDGAVDAARLASTRAPCDDSISDFYYRARVEFVNKNMVPSLTDYDHEQRNVLQQIVRELQGVGQNGAMTTERIEYVRKRILEGERVDKDYLPLQLKKAEFLASIGELTASREVVIRVERTVRLGRLEVEDWLNLDASLNASLVTLRNRTERLVTEQIANGQFKEALETAAAAVRAEPENPRYLYFAAVAAAVLRDHERTRHFVAQYLKRDGADCPDSDERKRTLFELYRRQDADAGPRRAEGQSPNWISGEVYPAGQASYDVISGSFNPRIANSIRADKTSAAVTHFLWDGFLASSIRTTTGPGENRQVVLDLEPLYHNRGVYMAGIGTKTQSETQRRVTSLQYLNSPEYDPLLAVKLSGKASTRGWAGNPFFHPFIWNEIFVFELQYDGLGRIERAIPVLSDRSRPVSPFSETLTFSWEGNSSRLKAITGANYRRELIYDRSGLLVSERISHPAGRGRILYQYRGNPKQLVAVVCEDNFYDRGKRTVTLAPLHR